MRTTPAGRQVLDALVSPLSSSAAATGVRVERLRRAEDQLVCDVVLVGLDVVQGADRVTRLDPGEATGYQHGLKYAFTAPSYARLVAALGSNLANLTDTQVAPYADHYFEYDSNHRVTKAVEQGRGSSATAGGLGPTPTPTPHSVNSSPGLSAGTSSSNTRSAPRPWPQAGPAISPTSSPSSSSTG